MICLRGDTDTPCDRADDFALLKWGYKRSREFARRMACYRGEYVPNHPQFAAGSKALCKGEIQPAAVDAPDLVYTAEDEKEIEEYTRKFVATAWHSVCHAPRLSLRLL